MKQKNPLYLVKGKTVHPAKSVWEYVVLKFNLRPLISILEEIMKYVLDQVKDYPSFVFAKNFIQEISEGLLLFKARLGF